jgi:hypothetical protein
LPILRCLPQVLTLEEWDLIAYSYVRETDYSSLAFFIAWIIVGKHILLTLFLAVVLEAFEGKNDTETVEDVSATFAAATDPCSFVPFRNTWLSSWALPGDRGNGTGG